MRARIRGDRYKSGEGTDRLHLSGAAVSASWVLKPADLLANGGIEGAYESVGSGTSPDL